MHWRDGRTRSRRPSKTCFRSIPPRSSFARARELGSPTAHHRWATSHRHPHGLDRAQLRPRLGRLAGVRTRSEEPRLSDIRTSTHPIQLRHHAMCRTRLLAGPTPGVRFLRMVDGPPMSTVFRCRLPLPRQALAVLLKLLREHLIPTNTWRQSIKRRTIAGDLRLLLRVGMYLDPRMT